MNPKKRHPKFRLLDLLLILSMATGAVLLFVRVQSGLHYRWNWAAIPQYLFRYDAQLGRWVPNLLILGFFNTIRLSIWATLMAGVLGTVAGLARTSRSLFNRLAGASFVEINRNLPPLVLIFICYYFISDQIIPAAGIEAAVRSFSKPVQALLAFAFAPPGRMGAFLSALVTLAVFESAYIAEIVRAGMLSIEKGQWEASTASGLSRFQQIRWVIGPQALRRIIPPLAGQFISTIKDSAIVSVISVQELTFQGMELMASTYLTFEIWITITALYLVLTLSLSMALSRLERRLTRHL